MTELNILQSISAILVPWGYHKFRTVKFKNKCSYFSILN